MAACRLPHLSQAVVRRPRLRRSVASRCGSGAHDVGGSPLLVEVEVHLGEGGRPWRLQERQAGCWAQKASVVPCGVPRGAALGGPAGQRSGEGGPERREPGQLLLPCRGARVPEEAGDARWCPGALPPQSCGCGEARDGRCGRSLPCAAVEGRGPGHVRLLGFESRGASLTLARSSAKPEALLFPAME